MRITYALLLLLFFGFAAHAQNDCPDAIIVCGDANYYDLEAEGPGQDGLEINSDNACASGENNTIWLKIQINQGGTLGFILTPEEDDMQIDFDFWLFGPIENCNNIGTAIRCSTTNPLQAQLDYITTGMNEESTDTSEGPGPDGDAFVHWITVQDNEFYYLAVDRPHGFGNFSMEWTGTATFHAVPVFLNPNNIPLNIEQCDKDGVNDQSTPFDLTVYNDMFIGTQSPMAITYHDDLNGAITGQDPILTPEAYSNISNPQTIYLRMVNTVTNCYSTHSFNIYITPSMVTGIPEDLYLCDIDKNGIREFDLSQNDDNVRGTNPPSTAVTYHTTLQDARNGTNPVGPLFTNTTPYLQNIWTRLEDTDGCFSYNFRRFRLHVTPLPAFTNPGTISLYIFQCDSDGVNDNTSVFDLTTHAAMLTNGQANLSITYHLTQEDADSGNNAITTPEAYGNISDPQTIYMRMYNSDTNCYDTLPFTIGLLRIPVGVPDNYLLCDTNENGFREFELNQNDDPLKNGDTGDVTYYLTEADAIAANNPIGPLYQNAAAYTTQTIWARFQKDFGDCVGYGITSFTIGIIPLPEIRNPENISFDQTKCDLDGVYDLSTPFDLTYYGVIMKGNQSAVSITYHTSQQDADDGNAILQPQAYANVTNPQTIYYRLTDGFTGCYKTGTFTITILPMPVIPELQPVYVCDFNNDGFAQFNLDAVLQQVGDALEYETVHIYETIEDAGNDVNAITGTSSYTNIGQHNQTLYIRAESALGCFDVAELLLIVNPVPEAVTPAPYPLCDNGDNDADGTALFDLTTRIEEILGGLDPAQYTVTFHTTQEAAVAGTPVIINVTSYNSQNAVIFGRVTNTTTGCCDVVPLELIVNGLPDLITNQSVYSLCDITAPAGDEKEVFDLTSKISDFIANQQNVSVSFHHTFADAQNNTAAIEDPANYTNELTPVETLFVRFTFDKTGCYRIGFLDVRVVPQPIILPPTQDELTVCDTNGQGFGRFNLLDLVEGMKNNEPNLAITFHETQENAQNGVLPIPNPESYMNSDAYFQFIYVRVTEPEYGCYNTYALQLMVEPAPQAPNLKDLTFCDDSDNNGQDGKRRVDLTVQNQVIADALGIPLTDIPTVINVEYYTTETGADSGLTNRITNPQSYIGTHEQVIWVRVENPETECYSITSFQLIFNAPFKLNIPAILALCNEALPNDSQTVFDLTVKEDEILGPDGVGQGAVFTYYPSPAEAQADINVITNPTAYTNTPAPPSVKTLGVKVTTKDGCVSFTTLTIKVLPLPTPDTTPDPLVECDDNGNGNGSETFDLTLAENDIKDNGSNYELTYHESEADALEGINPIPDPKAYESTSGFVWVRVALNSGNALEPKCAQIVKLELIVNPLPPVGASVDYAICEQDTDGFATFNLNTKIEEILGGNNEDLYDINFYFDQAALDADQALSRVYTNVVANEQTILVQVTNNETGCSVTIPMRLLVEEYATATQPADSTLETCDDDGVNDGFHSFDLTTLEDEVLGIQDPAMYDVTYHLSLEDAEEGNNPIPDPADITNTIADTQDIWIRVVNNQSVGECDAVVQITLIVHRLPEPELSGGTICVDFITKDVVRPYTIDSGLDNTHQFQWIHNGTIVPNETGPTIIIDEEGEEGAYAVIAISSDGCQSAPIDPVTIIKSGPASPVGNGYFVTNAFSDNQTITVRVEGYGQYEYRLDEGGQWQGTNVFTNLSPGTHKVYVRDITENGCDEIIIDGINIIDYPNFFTPNGDKFRDTWNIIGLDQPDAKIYIFDRYGKLLKQISAMGEGWDGTFNGHAMPASDYWFTVTYKEFDGAAETTKEFRAHFSLLR